MVVAKSRRQMKRHLYRLAVARNDFYHAAEACQTIVRMRLSFDDPLYFPLQEGAVIAYSRPFSGGQIGTLPAKYSKFENPRHRSHHKELLELRNTLVAHSDA